MKNRVISRALQLALLTVCCAGASVSLLERQAAAVPGPPIIPELKLNLSPFTLSRGDSRSPYVFPGTEYLNRLDSDMAHAPWARSNVFQPAQTGLMKNVAQLINYNFPTSAASYLGSQAPAQTPTWDGMGELPNRFNPADYDIVSGFHTAYWDSETGFNKAVFDSTFKGNKLELAAGPLEIWEAGISKLRAQVREASAGAAL